jgi:hypothetical protein
MDIAAEIGRSDCGSCDHWARVAGSRGMQTAGLRKRNSIVVDNSDHCPSSEHSAQLAAYLTLILVHWKHPPSPIRRLLDVSREVVHIYESGLLDRFHTRHPDLRVEFVMSDTYLDLAKGNADIALRSGDTDDGVLVGLKIADSIWAIYASQSVLKANGKPATIGDLANFPIAELDETMAAHRLSQWLAEVAPPCCDHIITLQGRHSP